MTDQDGYRAYLLRLWRSGGAGQGRWRASLEDPRTGARIGFASLARLHAFLLDQADEWPVEGPRREPPRPAGDAP